MNSVCLYKAQLPHLEENYLPELALVFLWYIHVPFGKGWQVLTLHTGPQLWRLILEAPEV